MKVLKSLFLTLLFTITSPSIAGDSVCPADRQDVCTKVIEVLNDALNKGLITKDQWDYEHLHLDIDIATYQRLGLESQFGGRGTGITSNQPEHMLIKDIITHQTDKEFFDLVLGVLDEAKIAWGQGGQTLPKFYIAAPDGSSSVSAAIDKTATATSSVPMSTLTPAIKVPTKPALDAKIKITKPQKSMPDTPDGRAAQRSAAASSIDKNNQQQQLLHSVQIQQAKDELTVANNNYNNALDNFNQANQKAINALNALSTDKKNTQLKAEYAQAQSFAETARNQLKSTYAPLQEAQNTLNKLQNANRSEPRASRIGGGGKADNNPDVIRPNPNDRVMAGDRTGTLVLQGQALQGPSGVRAPAGTAPDIVGASGGRKVPPAPAAQAVPTPNPVPMAVPTPLPAKSHKVASTNSKVVAYHLMKASQGSKGLHKTVSIVKQHPSNRPSGGDKPHAGHPIYNVTKTPGDHHAKDEKSFSKDENGRLWSCSISDMGMRRMVDIHGKQTVTGHSETLQYSSRILSYVPGLHVRDNRCLITVHK